VVVQLIKQRRRRRRRRRRRSLSMYCVAEKEAQTISNDGVL
jgi:hypothetical protein